MGLFQNLIENRKIVKLAKIDAGSTFNQTRQIVKPAKFETQKVAYEHGIDPKAAWANATASLGNSVASASTSIATGGKANFNSNYSGPGSNPLSNLTGNSNIIIIVIAVIGLLFISKK